MAFADWDRNKHLLLEEMTETCAPGTFYEVQIGVETFTELYVST